MRWTVLPLPPVFSAAAFSAFVASALLLSAPCCWAQWTQTAEQIPDYQSLPDRTDELQAQLDGAGGQLDLEDKHYRITRPLQVDLKRHGAASIRSRGGVTLIMDGPGPALVVVGDHQGTASPTSFLPETWNQRMPKIAGFEILGAHPEADGIELRGTVGAIVQQVSVRWCRHGIRLTDRNRNVIIANCHLYQNAEVGLYLDDVNLHQINVLGSHISYNAGGGVVVRDGNVRNLQISGCDIEGNMPADQTPTRTANVWIDVSGSPDDAGRSIAEVSITGCTIQHAANYSGDEGKTVAPGGANIRLSGKPIYPIDSVTITANVLSDTTHNIDISHAMDVTIGSNTFFAPKPDNLIVRNSRRVVVQGNTFNPRQFIRPGTIRFQDCSDCVIANSTLFQFATDQGAIVLDGCDGFSLSGLNLSQCGSGIFLSDSADVLISGCKVQGTEGGPDLVVDPSCQRIVLVGDVFGGITQIDPAALATPFAP